MFICILSSFSLVLVWTVFLRPFLRKRGKRNYSGASYFQTFLADYSELVNVVEAENEGGGILLSIRVLLVMAAGSFLVSLLIKVMF